MDLLLSAQKAAQTHFREIALGQSLPGDDAGGKDEAEDGFFPYNNPTRQTHHAGTVGGVVAEHEHRAWKHRSAVSHDLRAAGKDRVGRVIVGGSTLIPPVQSTRSIPELMAFSIALFISSVSSPTCSIISTDTG